MMGMQICTSSGMVDIDEVSFMDKDTIRFKDGGHVNGDFSEILRTFLQMMSPPPIQDAVFVPVNKENGKPPALLIWNERTNLYEPPTDFEFIGKDYVTFKRSSDPGNSN